MFDPLHKWLGIPPDEQPPHHYRLLGIAIFEQDTDVIDAAADKQLAFLHDLTNGEYAEQAELLSNQVSAARVCLLHTEKKRAYDDALRSQLERSLPAAAAARPAPEDSETVPLAPVVDVAPTAPAASAPAVKVRRRRRSRKSKSAVSRYVQYSSILCVIALLLIAVGVQRGVFRLGGSLPDSSVPTVSPPKAPSQAKTATAPPQPAEPEPEPEPPPTMPAAGLDTVAASSPSPTNDRSMPDPSTSPAETQGRPLSTRPAGSLGELVYGSQSADDTQPVVKSPLPSESQLEAKMQVIRELYEKEYRDAKTSKQKIELARAMHREGQETSEDPVGRFGLWRVARDIMTQEGDFVSALGIVANLDTHYMDVDADRMSLETLRDSAARISDSQLAEYLDTFASVVTRCDGNERFDLASSLCQFVAEKFDARITVSQRSEIERVQAKSQMVNDAFGRYRSAAETLKQSPDDPDANQAVGRYLCFIRNDWQAGLDHLRRGSDATIGRAAELESSGHRAASEAIAIADAWYDIAQSENQPLLQTTVRRHALDWYLTAQEVAQGLELRKAESRIASLRRSLGSASTEGDAAADPDSKLLSYRVLTSSESRRDFAHRKGNNEFNIGMGARPDGLGEAQAGIELQGVEKLSVVGSASHKEMPSIDSYTKSGFVIDYHTPGGYSKRVFLGLGLDPGREFTEAPPWGTARQPDVTTDIGRSNSYEIDLTRWAPSTWDGRCWFTIYMQNGGTNRSLQATVSW